MEVGERELEGEGTELDETEEETNETEESQEVKKTETVQESVEAALKDLEHENTRDKDGEEEEGPEPEPLDKQPSKLEEPAHEARTDSSFTRLSDEERKLISKLPKKLQRSVSRMLQNHEGMFTRTQQESRQALQRYEQTERETRHLLEAVRPYYTQNPVFSENGITEAQLVTQLIGTHQKLTDPKTGIQTWLNIGRQLGVDTNTVQAALQNAGTKIPENLEEHPQIRDLQSRLDRELSELQRWRIEQGATPYANAMEAVRGEKDPRTGQLVFPELQDPTYLDYVKPLVLEIARSDPNPSPETYANALREATLRKRTQFGFLAPSGQTKLPVGNNRAVSANVSVRGRTTPSASRTSAETEVPKNETPEQSVRRALEDLQRGVI